jgi:hypothetical protein
MRRPLVVLACLLATACASLSGSQPVKVVCASCALLQATGLCAVAPAVKAEKPCPDGQDLWILNYDQVLKNGAEPKVECR